MHFQFLIKTDFLFNIFQIYIEIFTEIFHVCLYYVFFLNKTRKTESLLLIKHLNDNTNLSFPYRLREIVALILIILLFLVPLYVMLN